MRPKLTKMKAGPIINIEAIEKTLQRPDLEQRVRLAGELLLMTNPVSLEQLCAKIGTIMKEHKWYSEQPKLPRDPEIDELITQGLSLYRIGQRLNGRGLERRSAGYVSAYLKSRGLYEYWKIRREEQHARRIFVRKQSIPPIQKPTMSPLKETKGLPTPSPREYKTYNASNTYKPGEKLSFPDFGLGTIHKVTEKRIHVRLNDGQEMEFRHGLEESPYQRRHGY